MARTAAQAVEWVRLLREEGRGFTKWELDFLESIEEQLEEGRTLSPKQEDILKRIHEDRS